MIDDYFQEIEDRINHSTIVIRSDLQKIKLDDFSGVIKGKVCFKIGILEFIEVIKVKNNPLQKKKKYKYHFMLNDNTFIFRYDNVSHHREIITFPHHKHIKNDTIESNEPNLLVILKEIKDYSNISEDI